MKRISSLLLTIVICFLPLTAFGQEGINYPTKPITFIIGFGAGGATDLTGRILCKAAERILGQPIVVENRAGGAGVIGHNLIAKAKPDGYTIGGFTASATVLMPHIREVPFKTKEDFSFICRNAIYSHALIVRGDAPWKTLKDFIEDSRKNPGKRTCSTTGAKSAQHINFAEIARSANVKWTIIHHNGNAEQLAALLGGHVDCALIANVSAQIKSGAVRPLAVTTTKRWKSLPDVPTFWELGYKTLEPTWWGVAGPKGIPKEILQKLESAFKQATQDPSSIEALGKIEMIPAYLPGEEFRKVVFRDYEDTGEKLKNLPLD
jgi:tripartite-type tricarboxylate transporter receptor subunit TctC